MDRNRGIILAWAKELQSMAAAGIQYTTNDFDYERFKRIRDIAAEMAAYELDLPPAQMKDVFAHELGYQTPKIVTRAAIFDGDQVLLVRERNGKWSMPGGWCDEDETVRSNTIKEAWEEAGVQVEPYRIVALDSQNLRNRPASFYGVCTVFVLCRVLGGEFHANLETSERRYFSVHDLTPLIPGKQTPEQVLHCYEAYLAEEWNPRFD